MIFLDMDEVLVDFVGGVCKLFDITKEQLLEHQNPNEWTIVPALAKATDNPDFTDAGMWEEIDQHGSDFWEDLEKLPWADELLELVDWCGTYHIVSSPNYHPHCYDGKVKWLKEEFAFEFNNFSIMKDKYLFAGEGRILIDDKPGNIESFRSYGGSAILFPSALNKLRGTDPIAYVKGALDQLCLL